MRTFRQAALAGATAAAVALGTTSVAGAEPAEQQERSLSSQIGGALGAYDGEGKPTGIDGRVFFGSSQGDLSSQPVWAQLLYAATIITGISAVGSLLLAPAYNFLVHGPLAP